MAKTLPRGIRNNNPLNIRRSDQKWKGKLPRSTDPEFEQFVTLEHGIRAALVCVRTYISKYHLNTPRLIIGRWAPTSENFTHLYVQFVTRKSGLFADEVIEPDDAKKLVRLLRAMAHYECGQPIDTQRFITAARMLNLKI